jgi:hypothetical protein
MRAWTLEYLCAGRPQLGNALLADFMQHGKLEAAFWEDPDSSKGDLTYMLKRLGEALDVLDMVAHTAEIVGCCW